MHCIISAPLLLTTPTYPRALKLKISNRQVKNLSYAFDSLVNIFNLIALDLGFALSKYLSGQKYC